MKYLLESVGSGRPALTAVEGVKQLLGEIDRNAMCSGLALSDMKPANDGELTEPTLLVVCYSGFHFDRPFPTE